MALLGLALLPWAGEGLRAVEAVPAAAAVTRRMVERSKVVARADGPSYSYQKRSLFERLDSTGNVVHSEEKLYLVTLIAGLPVNRLIKIQGRDLSPEELAREDAREEKFRERFVSAEPKNLAARKEGLVTPELLGRYDFAVEGRIVLSNRPTLVMTFKPRTGNLPSSTLLDKLLNRMAGRLWIDEAEADTARIEAHLIEPLHLGWWGWLGSLNQCELVLERRRMPDGVWVNARQVLLLRCRRLTTILHFRITEESSDFKQAAR